MAIDYSIKGKGNDRKTVNVINEYEYDSRGRIIRHPWDSDVEYLYDVTIKYRGTIDPSQDAPYHKTVKPGDAYIVMKTGIVTNDSDWRNLQGEPVRENNLLIFTDSETWYIVGGEPATPDSESVVSVNTIYDWSDTNNRTLRKLHYAEQTDTLFFEGDSDRFLIFDHATINPNQPVLLEAHTKGADRTKIYFSWSGMGNPSDGKLIYRRADGRPSPYIASWTNMFGGIRNADNSLSFAYLLDSEDQRSTYTIDSDIQIGDTITFISTDTGRRSVLRCFDGVNFKRVSESQVAVDSEQHDRKAADSDIYVYLELNLDSEIHDRKAADSDYYVLVDGHLDSEEHARKAADSDIYAYFERDLDSERHDWKASDSDILAGVGRVFVQNTNPNPGSPALRKGDTWIDTDDHKLYYYDDTNNVWIQVTASVVK